MFQKFTHIKISYLLLSLAFLLPSSAVAQLDKQASTVEFGNIEWRVAAKKAELTTHLGRPALALLRGRIWADDAGFKDGVISFDAAYQERPAFIGAGWRADTVSRQEEMYFRSHLNNKPDSLQYTPVENKLSAWQLFSSLNSTGPVDQKYNTWNNVKIVVENDSADIYFNSDEPVLHIPDLKADLGTGAVSLRATGVKSETVYFSNVVVRPLAKGEGVIGTAKPVPALPEGVIADWSISSSFAESELKGTLSLSSKHIEALEWQTLSTETSGIANLAKTSGVSKEANTVFARLNINADTPQMKELTFGYSDRVYVYLNGKRVYSGNAGWRVRDYRFLGTVGFYDSVGLDLKAGDNELLVGVAETFGGWGWAGAIADRKGIDLGLD